MIAEFIRVKYDAKICHTMNCDEPSGSNYMKSNSISFGYLAIQFR